MLKSTALCAGGEGVVTQYNHSSPPAPLTVRTVVLQNVAHRVEIFPYDQRLYRPHLERLQRVVDAEAELARVLRDLVEVATCVQTLARMKQTRFALRVSFCSYRARFAACQATALILFLLILQR